MVFKKLNIEFEKIYIIFKFIYFFRIIIWNFYN